MDSLGGELAILTRAGADIGPAIASALAQVGMRLALVDTRPGGLARPAEHVATSTSQFETYQADVTESSIAACVEAIVRDHGVPRVLISCPASAAHAPATELSEGDFREGLDANLIHAFLWSKIVGARMLANGAGVIVHVTGLSGMGGWPGHVTDSVVFGGIHNLVHTLAVEWAAMGVRVNALVPGITEATAETLEDTQERIRQRIPLARLATDQEICNALLYLIGPTATYISGEILRVDGGWDIWGQLFAVAKE